MNPDSSDKVPVVVQASSLHCPNCRLEACTTISIRSEAEAALRDHLTHHYPFEGCGVLLGKSADDNRIDVVRAIGTRNTELRRGRDRYAIDPRDLMTIERELLESQDGLRTIGYFHSHPDAPARPSSIDLEMAQGLFDVTREFHVYAIVSVNAAIAGEMTFWKLVNDASRFDELLQSG